MTWKIELFNLKCKIYDLCNNKPIGQFDRPLKFKILKIIKKSQKVAILLKIALSPSQSIHVAKSVRHGDYPRRRNFPAPFLVKLDCGNWINEAVSRTPALV